MNQITVQKKRRKEIDEDGRKEKKLLYLLHDFEQPNKNVFRKITKY